MIKKFFALSLSCLLPVGSPLLANAEPSAPKKIKVACVGDSITFGSLGNQPKPARRKIMKTEYFPRLKQEAAKK